MRNKESERHQAGEDVNELVFRRIFLMDFVLVLCLLYLQDEFVPYATEPTPCVATAP